MIPVYICIYMEPFCPLVDKTYYPSKLRRTELGIKEYVLNTGHRYFLCSLLGPDLISP